MNGFFFTTHILLEEALKYFLFRDINVRDGHFAFSCMRSDPLMRLVVPDLRVSEFPENEMGQVAVDILVDEIEAKLHHSSLPVFEGMGYNSLKSYIFVEERHPMDDN